MLKLPAYAAKSWKQAILCELSGDIENVPSIF